MHKIPNFLRVLLFTIVSVIILSFIIYINFDYPKVDQISSIEIKEIKNDSIMISTKTNIINNNFFSIKGNNIIISSNHKDELIGTGEIVNGLNLRPRKNHEITSNISISLKKISELWGEINKNDSIEFELIISGEFSPFKIKASQKQKINIDIKSLINKISENALSKNAITISNLKLTKVRVNNFKWKFDINAKNNQVFDVIIKDINVKIYPDNKTKVELGKWSSNKKNIILKAKKEVKINAELNVSLEGFVNTLINKFKNINNIFYIKSILHVEVNNYKFKIPYNQKVLFNPINQKITLVK